MTIVGIERMGVDELNFELQRGGKFVYYTYCISVVVMTFKRPSSVYFIRAGESAVTRGLGFALISFLLGWWGIPWGPIWTVGTIVTNLGGGKDVTREVVASMTRRNA